jgi:hypothetical protein
MTPEVIPSNVPSSPSTPNLISAADNDRKAVASFREYVHAELSDLPTGTGLADETRAILTPMIARVAQVEGPVHSDVIIGRLRDRYGLDQASGKTRRHAKWAISEALRATAVLGADGFLWSEDGQLRNGPREAGEARQIDQIHDLEIDAALISTIPSIFGGSRKEIIDETARRFGFLRTGPKISDRLSGRIDRLGLDDGLGRVRLPPD